MFASNPRSTIGFSLCQCPVPALTAYWQRKVPCIVLVCRIIWLWIEGCHPECDYSVSTGFAGGVVSRAPMYNSTATGTDVKALRTLWHTLVVNVRDWKKKGTIMEFTVFLIGPSSKYVIPILSHNASSVAWFFSCSLTSVVGPDVIYMIKWRPLMKSMCHTCVNNL